MLTYSETIHRYFALPPYLRMAENCLRIRWYFFYW